MKQNQLPIYVKQGMTVENVLAFAESKNVSLETELHIYKNETDTIFEVLSEHKSENNVIVKLDIDTEYKEVFKDLFQIVPTAYKVHRSQAERFAEKFPDLKLQLHKTVKKAFEVHEELDYIYYQNEINSEFVGGYNIQSKDYHIIEDYATPIEEKPKEDGVHWDFVRHKDMGSYCQRDKYREYWGGRTGEFFRYKTGVYVALINDKLVFEGYSMPDSYNITTWKP